MNDHLRCDFVAKIIETITPILGDFQYFVYYVDGYIFFASAIRNEKLKDDIKEKIEHNIGVMETLYYGSQEHYVALEKVDGVLFLKISHQINFDIDVISIVPSRDELYDLTMMGCNFKSEVLISSEGKYIPYTELIPSIIKQAESKDIK